MAIMKKLEREKRQVVRLVGVISFLKNCFREGLLPRSLWFHLPGRFDNDDKLRSTVARNMLRAEISSCVRQREAVLRSQEVRESCLYTILENEDLANRVRQYFSAALASFRTRSSACFESRLNRLRILHGQRDEPSVGQRDAPSVDLWEERLVHNASSATLDEQELSVLRKGLNYAVCPRSVPKSDLIASVESAIVSCTNEEKAFVRRKAAAALEKARVPQPNLTSEENEALKRLREREDVIILPADKGKATVILDRAEYQRKLRSLLDDGPYRPAQRDPGPKLRRDLRSVLVRAVDEGRLTRAEHIRLCPTHFQTPHIFGLPKVHKAGLPLRPIVSLRDSVLAPISRVLAAVMKPFVHCDSYIRDSEDLVQNLRSRGLTGGEFASLDVESLFTNVPVSETLDIFERLLREDSTLRHRTFLSVEEILDLSRLVLTTCYFKHFDGFFVQTDGVAMGSSLGPVAANVFMAHFENMALRESLHAGFYAPSMWLRYVDDVLIYWTHTEVDLLNFVRFLNEVRPSIRFSLERQVDDKLPFLDVLICNRQEGLSFEVYRKPTHTDLYIRRSSAHPASVFKGVVRALGVRAQRVCSRQRLPEEMRHLRKVLRRNGYGEAEITRGLRKAPIRRPADPTDRRHSLPYFPGVSERISKVLREVGVLTALRPVRTLRSLLVKKRPEPSRIFGSVYSIKCMSCPWLYVGETGRSVEERGKEHARAVRCMDVQRSEVARHVIEDGHDVDVSGVSILDKEDNWRRRIVKEALWTRRLGARNKVMHELGHSWKF